MGIARVSDLTLERSLAMVGNPKVAFPALLLQAEAYQNLGQIPQELESLGKAIKVNPRNPEAYFIRGVTYRSLGQLNLAVDDLSQAISMYDKKSLRLGLVRLGSGQLDKEFWERPRVEDREGRALNALFQEREEER